MSSTCTCKKLGQKVITHDEENDLQKNDASRIWTCAGEPSRFQVYLLNHSDIASAELYTFDIRYFVY